MAGLALCLSTLPRVCKWCGNPCFGRRRTWCSAACEEEYLLRSNGAHVRWRLFQRDKGVCARCGYDTMLWFGRLRRVRDSLQRKYLVTPSHDYLLLYDRFLDLCRKFRDKGYPVEITYYGDPLVREWWDAHHRHAVMHGGGGCGLEGFETLCVPCHRKETRRQMAKVVPAFPDDQLPMGL